MAFESLPLWVWAILVGVLIASKFIYRCRVTRELARDSQEKHKRIPRTLNTADKHYLFKISDALKRRFDYIELPAPSHQQRDAEI